jgi:hypothetical protein
MRVSVGLSVYPHIVARQQLGKYVPTAMQSCWKRLFLCGMYDIRGMQTIYSPWKFLLAYFLYFEKKLSILIGSPYT